MYSVWPGDKIVSFYKISDNGVDLVARSAFKLHKKYIEVNNVMYFGDEFNEVDFEHPSKRKCFWRILKEFLKF